MMLSCTLENCFIRIRPVYPFLKHRYSTASTDKKVAVIGTGVSGISALRNLTSPSGKIKPIAFERSSSFGGHWSFTNDRSRDQFGYPPSSAIYCGLRTNLPKQLMSFPGFEHEEQLPTFPTQGDVFNYLKRYVDACDLEKYIQYNTVVTKVEPKSPNHSKTKWDVTWCDVRDPREPAELYTEEFDAVVICNGNCVFPNVPSFPGIEKFKGDLIHSRDYRQAADFRRKKVAVVGSSYSGKDVARQLSETADKVYLTHIDQPLTTHYPNKNVIEKNIGIKCLKESSMVLENGEEIDIDGMVMCTGYKYRFPFLSNEIISTEGERVTPLYKHVLHVKYHSLMVISVLRNVALYPTSFNQAKFVRSVIDGVAKLPSIPEMEQDIATEEQYRRENNLIGPMWHYMDTLQWQYDRELAKMGKFEPISDILHTFWDYVERHREQDFCNYWKYDYVMNENNAIDAIKRDEYLENDKQMFI